MPINSKTVEGIYRNGNVELLENPANVEESRVIVTFLTEGMVDLAKRGIDERLAASLRARLIVFVEDWGQPEMTAYDAL
jgi:hypothetical protein